MEGLRLLEDNSIDSIVTDPPYQLGFMNKTWDKTGITYDVNLWKECLRVLKPGGHLLAFGSTRTYHRMACAIEDAEFEIRDCLMYCYGSGFPKSRNIGKDIDKMMGVQREVVGEKIVSKDYNRNGFKGDMLCLGKAQATTIEITAPATPEAQQWQGWGTALKPAVEPIVMARKPISEKNIAANVLKWGTGGINIDGCKVKFAKNDDYRIYKNYSHNAKAGLEIGSHKNNTSGQKLLLYKSNGRWPANLLLDEEAAKMLDEQSGISKSCGGGKKKGQQYGKIYGYISKYDVGKEGYYGDIGGASRFFYCTKASKKEKGEFNNHPTVKPLALIKYLIILVTPPGGICLDPFEGSGTHALACKELGFNYIGFELSQEYIDIAHKRLII